MSKRAKIIAVTGWAIAIIGFSVANAQISNPLWKLISGSLMPGMTSWTLTVPTLGGSGTRCLQTDNTGLVSKAAAACGSGSGGGSGGTWATTTSPVANQLINYSLNDTDIVVIGSSATTTARYYFDPNTLTAVLNGLVTAGRFTATTTVASVFPYASSTAITVSGSSVFEGRVGVGSSTPFAKLAVTMGTNDIPAAPVFLVASSTATATSTLFVVTNAGWVSVGNRTPPDLFQLTDDSGFMTCGSPIVGYVGCNFSNAAVTTTNYNILGNTSGQLFFNRITGQSMDWRENNSTQMTLATGGNLGIATTSPFGVMSVEQGTETASLWIGNNGSSTPSLVVSGVNGNGHVGIGVVNPAKPLTVEGKIGHKTFSSSFLNFLDTGVVNLSANSTLNLGFEGAINLTLLNTGITGVSSSTPYATLSVEQTGVFKPFVVSDQGTSTPMFIVDANARVGVGTSSPGSLFSIQGVANFQTGTTTFQTGINLMNGQCFAIGGTCVGGGGSGTVTSIATTWPVIGGPITTTGTLTFGGLSTSSAAVLGNIPYFSGVNTFANVATTTLTGTAPIAFSQPVFVIGPSASVITCATATASVPGCISAASFSKHDSATTTFSTGLTYTSATNAVTVNTSQNIATLSNLTTNGFVTTAGGVGTLGVQAFPVTIAQGGTNSTAQITGTALWFNGTSIVATSSTLTSGNYIATTTAASVFPYASTTALTSSGFTALGTGGNDVTIGTTTTTLGELQIYTVTEPHECFSVGGGVNAWCLRVLGDGSLRYATTTAVGSATSTPDAITMYPTGQGFLIGTTSNAGVTGLGVRGTVFFDPTLLTTQSGAGNVLCLTTVGQVVQDDSPITACSGASSIRFKDILGGVENPLDKVRRLNPVAFRYKPEFSVDQKVHLGFVAEQLAKVEPRLVEYDKDGKPYGVEYQQVTALLAGAVKELADRQARGEWGYLGLLGLLGFIPLFRKKQ